jgi:alginate O-acetyltransferase complex protein AlgI
MLFNSLAFLYGFLPITYIVYWRLKTLRQRYLWLALTGYVFYGFWNAKFCLLMAFSTLISFVAGLGFLKAEENQNKRLKKLCLVIPVCIDLSLLFFFKYFNFTLNGLEHLFNLISSHQLHFTRIDVILPIGISFYTFHTISYIVDCYRGTIRPTKNLPEFACYVSLFSQLVAGPIVRFGQIEEDLAHLDRGKDPSRLSLGSSYFVIGLVKKVLLADTIAMIINPALKDVGNLSTATAWLCALGYTYQLYFDFSGYSDMAVGLGHLFNIRIPQNFNSPYKACGISDFWRRWHISLSSCLRDYLYIPLGGNRSGKLNTYRNLMLTFLFGGLWHGANITFLIWGLYHGFLLCLNHLMQKIKFPPLPRILAQTGTFFLVVIGWVIFRADNLGMAENWFEKMFSFSAPENGWALPGLQGLVVSTILCGMIAHLGKNSFELKHRWNLASSCGLAALLGLSLFLITGGTPSPFLYFQF